MLVGSSELTGRYWNGAASIFLKSSADNKTLRKDIYLTNGSADGCFTENSRKVEKLITFSLLIFLSIFYLQ